MLCRRDFTRRKSKSPTIRLRAAGSTRWPFCELRKQNNTRPIRPLCRRGCSISRRKSPVRPAAAAARRRRPARSDHNLHARTAFRASRPGAYRIAPSDLGIRQPWRWGTRGKRESGRGPLARRVSRHETPRRKQSRRGGTRPCSGLFTGDTGGGGTPMHSVGRHDDTLYAKSVRSRCMQGRAPRPAPRTRQWASSGDGSARSWAMQCLPRRAPPRARRSRAGTARPGQRCRFGAPDGRFAPAGRPLAPRPFRCGRDAPILSLPACRLWR